MQEVARNALILGVLLYGCEAWALLKGDQDKLERFHRRCVRTMALPGIYAGSARAGKHIEQSRGSWVEE